MTQENNNKKQIIISTNTLIPIGLVSILAGAIWFIATMSANVSANTNTIDNVKSQIGTLPTRVEFDKMNSDIMEIKADIKTLLKEK